MTKPKYFFAIGRRKAAVSRVRLYHGKGEMMVNGLPAIQYFPGALFAKLYLEPLVVCGLQDKYYATIKVSGSGKMSQLLAAVHGLSRALVKLKPEHKKALRAKNLLTRDPRERQRRMVGMGGKSRRRKQSPKR